MRWGPLSGEVTTGVHFPDPHPTLALTHFLLLRAGSFPRGLEAEPELETGRQDAEVPGSTPHPCPSFSGHQERRGQLPSLPPSLLGKGRRESVEYAGRCWAGRCCHKACLPPTLWIRNRAAFSWGPVTSRLAHMAGLTLALSSGQQHRRRGSDQSRPRSQVSGQPQARDRFCQSFNPTEGSKRDPFQKNKESLTPQAPFFLKRSQTPGSGLLGETGSPLGLCLYPGREKRQIR